VILVIPALWFVLCVSRFAPFIDQTWGIIFASTLILLSAIPDSKFAGNALGRAFVWLGTISYSVYLLHEPLIRVVTPAIMHIHEPYIAGIVRIPILIAVGYGFHRVVERPFMRLSSNSRRAVEIAAADNPAP
jgi:peptidoglycan/LPS O-acetylase OafA/YrhL